MISNINDFLSRFEANSVRDNDAEKSWSISSDVGRREGVGSAPSAIRWDHLKPFPSGVAANKMWEHWNRYVENFEIAASLSNVLDPVKRTQLLYLSMGSELQEITKAAKLRPSLSSPNCYNIFVSNIQKHLRSMTDSTAEHEAFTRMKQENGESAVAFHARLMGKVRSCNYSVDDEDRFVRAQLLAGLKNEDLVKDARTYGYNTNYIVQSATRSEAFKAESRQRDDSSVDSNVMEIRSGHNRSSYNQFNRKRITFSGPPRSAGPPARQRNTETNRRSQGRQCTKCSLFNHRNGRCPAIDRNCNKCGKRGHFAAACRQRQVNVVQNRQHHDKSPDRIDNSEDDKQENKQVLT